MPMRSVDSFEGVGMMLITGARSEATIGDYRQVCAPDSSFEIKLFCQQRELGPKSIDLSQRSLRCEPSRGHIAPCRSHGHRRDRDRVEHAGSRDIAPSFGKRNG
jgi:hypothetical protein